MFIVAPSQIEKFRNDGFLIVENLIDDETARTMHACFERLFRGQFETGITPDEVNWQEGESDPTLTRQICNGWKPDRTIAEVILRQDIGQAIAQLGGSLGARIMVDNLIWKPADTRSLGYHQDSAFLSWYAPSDLLSCWIALDDTTAAGGTLEFVRGSHKWKQRSPEGEFHGPEDYRKSMQAAAAEEGVEPDIVYVEVPRGGGSFHDGWTWHGSGHERPGARWFCTPCVPIPATYPATWAKVWAACIAATSTWRTTI